MSDIVERLRNHANGLWEKHPLGDYGICDEAAETILALRKEVEGLRSDVTIWKGEAANRSEAMVQLNLDRAALGVENVQLREALTYLESEARRFAGMYQPHSDGRNTFVIFADKIAKSAEDAALATEAE